MARRLTSMSWADMQAEMSIAGSPEKIAGLGDQIMKHIESSVDYSNIAEITNMQFALRRVLAELKLSEKMQRERQTISIKQR